MLHAQLCCAAELRRKLFDLAAFYQCADGFSVLCGGVDGFRKVRELEILLAVDFIAFFAIHLCIEDLKRRLFCADIGKALGCGGVMETLERTKASVFTLGDAHTLSEIEAMSDEEREKLIIPVERVFEAYDVVRLEPFFARLARCGVEIYLKKINTDAELGEQLTLYDSTDFFALGEVREFEDGLAIKPIKQFDV